MSSFTIGKKLLIGVGVLVALTFALGVTALVSISGIGDRFALIVGQTVQKKTLAHGMTLDSALMDSATRGILMRGLQKDQAGVDRDVKEFADAADDLQSSLNTIRPLLITPTGIAAAADIQDSLGVMRQANLSITQALSAGDSSKAFTLYSDAMKPVETREKNSAATLLKACDDLFASSGQQTESTIASVRWVTGLMLALACTVGVVLVFVVLQIVRVLRGNVSELTEASVQIASAAGQVSSTSQSLAQGSSEQAATIEETSGVSTEINSMAQRNTENSRSTADMVTHSQEDFEKTNLALTEMVGAMEGINASSQKISKIIKVIDEIAFQTNILALNAAVEAARAGEAGMGFAVVADEVRNLAQRCAQAAKDTADLIEESIQRSDGGRVKVDQVAVAIRAITAESSKIKVLVDEINLGSVEQSRGIDQINRAIIQMEQVTQSNAANAEESAAAAEELNAQAEAMKDVVESLQGMVNGGAAISRAARNPQPSARMAGASRAWTKPSTAHSAIARVKSAIAVPVTKMVSKAANRAMAAATPDLPMEGDFKEF